MLSLYEGLESRGGVTLKRMKPKKVVGPDGILVEVWR